MLVKETREDYRSVNDHDEYFHFYVIGDFYSDELKKEQALM